MIYALVNEYTMNQIHMDSTFDEMKIIFFVCIHIFTLDKTCKKFLIFEVYSMFKIRLKIVQIVSLSITNHFDSLFYYKEFLILYLYPILYQFLI